MKKNIFTLLIIAMGLSSCQDTSEEIVHNFSTKEFNEMNSLIEQSSYVDDVLFTETLINYSIVPASSFIEVEDGWLNNNKPNSSFCAGIVFYDNEIFSYYFIGFDDALTKFGGYRYSYDAETNILYTNSLIHDYTYSCEVKYFDGEYLIVDGLFAPTDDVYNENYAHRRIKTKFKVEKEIRKLLEDGTYKVD